jgi:RimJ/RimL family protein N-acetyltransferase
MPARRELSGRCCRLEPLDARRHAESLFAAYARDRDGRGWTYLPYGPFDSPASLTEWVARSAASTDPLFFAVLSQALTPSRLRQGDGGRASPQALALDAVGVAAYLRVMPASGSIEVGHIHFSPLLQRTPAATEAMYLMMRHAFELGYRRYEWKCDALNAPSRAAARRLGFSFEGIFRQATVYKGRSRDTAWYAVTDKEWPTLCAAFERWLDPVNFDADGHQRASLSALTAPLVNAGG